MVKALDPKMRLQEGVPIAGGNWCNLDYECIFHITNLYAINLVYVSTLMQSVSTDSNYALLFSFYYKTFRDKWKRGEKEKETLRDGRDCVRESRRGGEGWRCERWEKEEDIN